MSPKRLEITIPDSDDPKDDPASAKAAETMIATARESIDTFGSTKQVKSWAELVRTLGFPAVVLAVFLIVFVTGLFVVRSDFLTRDRERQDANERSLRDVCDSFKRSMQERREDEKERDRRHEANQERIHQRLSSIGDRMGQAAGAMDRATVKIEEAAEELKKIAKKPG